MNTLPNTDLGQKQKETFEPVTLMVRRTPLPGREREFEKVLADTIHVALTFPGHLGVTVLRPDGDESGDYRLIVKYDSPENLRRWERSPEAIHWFAKLAELEAKPVVFDRLCGLETWFALPRVAAGPAPIIPPPRYKMAVVTLVGVLPTITALLYLMTPLMTGLPLFARAMILAPLMVFLLTYIIMPQLTRLFKRWLYPEHG